MFALVQRPILRPRGPLPLAPLAWKVLAFLLTVGVALTCLSGPAAGTTYPGEYVSPTTGTSLPPTVTRPFDELPNPYLPGHRGIDVLTAPGALVFATGDGVVRFAGIVVTQPTVSIYHAQDIITTYQPVTAWVAPGQPVHKGQPIGVVANVPSPHTGLHWGAKTGPKTYMDPLDLMHDPKIRLLPVPIDIQQARTSRTISYSRRASPLTSPWHVPPLLTAQRSRYVPG